MELDRKKAVIFDLDDTLVDSVWMWEAIDIEYPVRLGLTCSDDLQKEIEGMSFSEIATYLKERLRLKEPLDEVKSAWIQTPIKKYRKEVTLKLGAWTFLEFISGKGLMAGIATSNGRTIADAVPSLLDICRYFKVAATACEMAVGKPTLDIYLNVAERLKVASKDCVVFEDVPAGIQAGKNAGVTVSAVEDASSLEMKAEKEQLADYHIRDYCELLDGVAG